MWLLLVRTLHPLSLYHLLLAISFSTCFAISSPHYSSRSHPPTIYNIQLIHVHNTLVITIFCATSYIHLSYLYFICSMNSILHPQSSSNQQPLRPYHQYLCPSLTIYHITSYHHIQLPINQDSILSLSHIFASISSPFLCELFSWS